MSTPVKVLVVDDHKPFRSLVRGLLANVAAEVEECEDGADAVAAYARNRPDVVLMDIGMKRMDGFAATRMIIAHDSSARVVIVSSYDDETLRDAAIEAGACGYAVKDNLAGLGPLIVTTLRN